AAVVLCPVIVEVENHRQLAVLRAAKLIDVPAVEAPGRIHRHMALVFVQAEQQLAIAGQAQRFVVTGKELGKRTGRGKVDPADIIAADVLAQLPAFAAADTGAPQLAFLPPSHEVFAQWREFLPGHETGPDGMTVRGDVGGNGHAGSVDVQAEPSATTPGGVKSSGFAGRSGTDIKAYTRCNPAPCGPSYVSSL